MRADVDVDSKVATAYADTPETEASKVQKVVIPYVPRKHFLPLHFSKKRWKFVVAHRRAGKSVAAINEMIKRAMENTRTDPPPRYAYVGPSFDQTKDLIWGYLKHFAGGIPNVRFLEGDLMCILPNGASIRLYGGAAAYERMRGLYFDGIMLDEFPLLHPAVFSTVVRPCLADYRGWAIISGTSNGDDHFAALRNKNIANEAWDIFEIPVTKTDALHPDEVIEMTQDMTPEEYAREMLCSFDAPIEGSYYGETMNDLQLNGHVTRVPYDPAAVVFTAWDLGIDDNFVVWYFQIIGKALHVIREQEWRGKGFDDIVRDMKEHKYVFGGHLLPHDVKVRELGTGKSRYQVLMEILGDIYPVPIHRVEDGIAAVRSVLKTCYFDETNTEFGRSALKNYHQSKAGKPVHNWASHAADAFRILSAGLNLISALAGAGNVVSMTRRKSNGLRRRIGGR